MESAVWSQIVLTLSILLENVAVMSSFSSMMTALRASIAVPISLTHIYLMGASKGVSIIKSWFLTLLETGGSVKMRQVILNVLANLTLIVQVIMLEVTLILAYVSAMANSGYQMTVRRASIASKD